MDAKKLNELLSAECIHDGERRCYEEPDSTGKPNVTHTYWCTSCGAKLYIDWIYTYTGRRTDRSYCDDIYWMLYSQTGRLELLKYLLQEKGMKTPKFWEDKDDV